VPVVSFHVYVIIGAVVGFGSAITGTSGPVILLPLLFFAEFPSLYALGLAQGIQIPIAVAATIGNLIFSFEDIDWLIWALLASTLGVAIPLGVAGAHHLPQFFLKAFITVGLLVGSIALLVRTAMR